MENVIKELEQKLLSKEQECEELKKELAKVYEDIKLSPLCYKCDEEECLRKEIDELKTENRKLKQTLAEIKEIAEEAGNTQYLTFPDFNLQQNAKMLMGQFNGYLQQILQKISKCEI